MHPRLTPTPAPADGWLDGLGERVGLDAVLTGLDRRARFGLAPGLGVRRALTWDRADRHDLTWWPQGLTSSADAGREDRLLVASWYSKQGDGVRITFLDRRSRRYRHVPLALVRDRELAALPVHAGGLVWRGPWLYVAATGRGCYVAHVEDILRRCSGPHAGELVWPVRFRYAAEDGMRYSFLSLTDEGDLLAGEYGGPAQPIRLARFTLETTGPGAGLLRLDADGAATAVGVDIGVPSMQGAALVGGRYRLMVSRGRRRPGDLWVGPPGRLRVRSFLAPPGPEDVTYWPAQRLLWSVTEFPGRRWLFALRCR